MEATYCMSKYLKVISHALPISMQCLIALAIQRLIASCSFLNGGTGLLGKGQGRRWSWSQEPRSGARTGMGLVTLIATSVSTAGQFPAAMVSLSQLRQSVCFSKLPCRGESAAGKPSCLDNALGEFRAFGLADTKQCKPALSLISREWLCFASNQHPLSYLLLLAQHPPSSGKIEVGSSSACVSLQNSHLNNQF